MRSIATTLSRRLWSLKQCPPCRFGAKLDATLAGSRAVSRSEILAALEELEQAGRGTPSTSDDEARCRARATRAAELLYAEGVEAMNRGQYNRSVALLNNATALAGAATRQGGQMQLWLGQALFAARQRPKAFRVLAALEKHPDGDVRRVASELKFIYDAPALKLNASELIAWPTAPTDVEYVRRPDGRIQRQSRRNLPEEPEYGSLEWCEAQVALGRPRDEQVDPALAAAAVVLCVVAILLFRHP